MSNIQFMMHLLNFYTNQKLKRKFTMEIIDLKDEQGEANESFHARDLNQIFLVSQ